MFNVVNLKTRGSIATWNVHGITLFKGANYSDLYHEAWHGFTQMFMTKVQRDALYAEAAKQSGTFNAYTGRTVAYSEATIEELEEKMAEDFREYMLKNQPITQPVKKSFFQKILDLLKSLFGKSTTVEAIDNFTGNPVIDELYHKLKVGDLTNYTFDQANAEFSLLNSRRNSGINNYEDIQLACDSIDSLFSELIRTLNSTNNTKIYTSALIKDTWGRKMAYRYALEQMSNRLNQLIEEKNEMTDEDFQDDINYEIDLLTKAVSNFGDPENVTEPTGLMADHMALSKLIEFDDRLLEEEVDVTKKNEFQSKAGNEVGLQQLANPSLLYAIRSLRDYNADGSVKINRLGFEQTGDFEKTWKRLVNLTKGARNVNDIYNILKERSVDYPTIAEFLDNVGSPMIQETSSQNLWTEIEKIFTMPEIQLMNVQIKMKKGSDGSNRISYVTASISTGEFKKIGQLWDNNFALLKNSDYITKTAGKINTLNVAAVIRAFPSVNESNMFAFMEAIGMPLESAPSAQTTALDPVNGIMSQVMALHRVLKNGFLAYNQKAKAEDRLIITRPTDILRDYSNRVTKDTAPALKQELSGSTTKLNDILKFQLNWSDAFTSTTVSNAEGESQEERSLRSTLSNQITDINSARTITELTQGDGVTNPGDRSMGHLSASRNPFVKTLMMMNRLFDKNGNKRKTAKGQDVKIELLNMSGVQVLQEEVDGIIESSGISTSNSDAISRYMNEFLMTMLHGASMATQPADKSTALLYRVVDQSGDTHYINPRKFVAAEGKTSSGQAMFVNQMLGYLSSEYERIRMLKSGDEAGDATVGNKGKLYRETGSEYVIFDKILSNGSKAFLGKLWNMSNPINTSEQFLKYLSENKDIREGLQKEILEYLDSITQAAKKQLTNIGFYGSNELMMPIVRKMNNNVGNIQNSEVFNNYVNAIAVSFAANSWIHKYESTLLFHGDPALYDGLNDFFKRNSGYQATGTFPRTDKGMVDFINSKIRSLSYAAQKYGIPPKLFGNTMTSAVLEDTKTTSVHFDDYVSIVKENEKARLKQINASEADINKAMAEIEKIFSDAYKDMKEGDGQGWINIDAYRSLLMSMNEWSNYQEELYEKIIKGEDISAIDIKQFMPVKKMQYWGPLDTNGLPVIGFHKFSLMPLLPNMIKNSNLETLQQKMLEQGVDYAMFQSGSKINSITTNGKVDKFYVDNTSNTDKTPAFAADDFKFTPNNIFLRYFKNQLEVSDVYKGKNTFSSQMRKLIEYGLVENGVPTDWRLDIIDKNDRVNAWEAASEDEKNTSNHLRLYTEYEKALDDYVKYEIERLRRDIGGDKEKLVAFIKKELSRKELADHTIDFIEVDPKTKNFKYDLDFSLDADNIEKMLVALVQKRLINQKFNGESLVQVSGSGFESKTKARLATEEEEERIKASMPFYSNNAWTEWLADPSKPRPSKNNTTPMGVMLSMQGDFKKLLKLKEVKDLAAKNGSDALTALNLLIKDPEWLSKNKKLITSVGVRIPVQLLNSMEYMQIVEFLPESSGNVLVLPSEIVGKSGGDFDIDKIFTLFPNLKSKTVLDSSVLSALSQEMKYEFTVDRMNEILDKDEAGEFLTDFEKKAIDFLNENVEDVDIVTLHKGKNSKGLQNKILEIASEILSLDHNFPTLITPNTTVTLQGLAEEMYKRINGKDRNAKGSATNIFEVDTNVYKQQSNSIGKAILGIIAVSNTFNTIFDRTGLLLDKSRILNPQVKDPQPLYQRLLLKHNTINGQISMSSLYSANGMKKIGDLISELINGSVDVAKDAWIFDIQGNKELINSLVFMIMAGVNAKEAITMISQPIIKDYVNLQKRYKSTFSVPLDKIDHENMFRIHARDGILFNEENGFPFTEEDVTNPKSGRVDKGKLFTKLTGIANEGAKFFNEKTLDNNLNSKNYTDVDRAVFAHFLEIQEMSSQITQLTQNLNFDTTQTKTLFDARAKMDKVFDLSNGIEFKYIDRIMKNSPLGAFTIQPFIRELYKDLFPLRDNETVNDFIDSWFDKSGSGIPIIYDIKDDLGIEDDDTLIRMFRTDLPSFIFQNNYYSFDPNTNTYTTSSVSYNIVEQLNLNTIAGVKDGILYVDKKTLRQSFKSRNYSTQKSWDYDVAPVNPKVFSVYNDDVAEALYTKFVYERETLRTLPKNSFDKIKDSADFKEYYNEIVKREIADPEKKAYEYVIRDRALANLNLHVPMFYGEKAYGKQVMDLESLHPEMYAKYYVLQRLQADTFTVDNQSFTNLKFAGKPTPIELNRMHQDILDLANPSVQKVADPDENQRISELFQKFTHFALLQSGIDQRSTLSLIKAAPLENYIALLEEPRKKFLDLMNSDNVEKYNTLMTYMKMFKKQYGKSNSKFKNKLKNYASESVTKIPGISSSLNTNVQRVFSVVSSDLVDIAEVPSESGTPSNRLLSINGVTIDLDALGIYFQPNQQQIDALRDISRFIDEPFSDEATKNMFTLMGYAGTGKSSITKILLNYIEQTGKKFEVTAPTHKAKGVIAKLTGKPAKTIQKNLNLKPEIDVEKIDLKDLNFIKNEKEQVMAPDILIIDECSFVGEGLFEYIKDFTQKNGDVKVLFIGDPAQLKPVDKTEKFANKNSPTFDIENKVELTQVERQKGSNPLGLVLDAARNGVNSSTDKFEHVSNIIGDQGIAFTDSVRALLKQASAAFLSNNFKNNRNFVRIVAYTNNRVAEYNTYVRKQMGYDQQYVQGDLLMAYDNIGLDRMTGDYTIKNSVDYEVIQAVPIDEYHIGDSIAGSIGLSPVAVSGFRVTMNELGDNKPLTYFVISRDTPQETLEQIANFLDTLVKKSKQDNKLWASYYRIKESILTPVDIKNAEGRTLLKKSIDYGYAHTIHKSQGVTYTNIMVDMDDINKTPDLELRNQMKYVAMSRATNIAYVVSNKAEGAAPNINWDMDVQSTKPVAGKTDVMTPSQKKVLSKEDMKTLDSFSIMEDLNTGILNFHSASDKQLTDKDVLLLKEDYPEAMFLVNGFNQQPGKAYNTAGTNSVFMSMGPESSDFVNIKNEPNTTTGGKPNQKAFLTDATYDENIKRIDEDLARWKSHEESGKKLIFDALGYGQYMIGKNERKIYEANMMEPVAPRTFDYLSAQLLDKFGYLNPNYISRSGATSTIQQYQQVTDAELMEQKKICKL